MNKGFKYNFIVWLKQISIIIVAITVIVFWAAIIYIYFELEDSYSFCSNKDNIAVIKMHGNIDLIDYPDLGIMSVDPIVETIEELSKKDNIDYIILDIYSYGGIGSAGEVVMKALKRSPKTTIALLREAGLSSAYLAASGADHIYATRFTDVGSIGITMSFLDEYEKITEEGLRFVSLSSAEFKDMFSKGKEITEEEKDKAMRHLEKLHNTFIETVSENRNIPIEKVKALADGSIFTAEESIDNGLIDYMGDLYDILNEIEEKNGKVRVCSIDFSYEITEEY